MPSIMSCSLPKKETSFECPVGRFVQYAELKRFHREFAQFFKEIIVSTTSDAQVLPQVREFLRQPRGMFIDGQFVKSASGKTFATHDPSTGDVIANVAEAGAEDVDRAVRAARRALELGPWKAK